ncbi:dihydroneopterin aldolase [Sphingomonas sp. GCM10030256]|uniref:dihydroneopterin aldolase n=1 Tax=Sphingomonas sp. GCM10030256 TaxID=3273427 RepID=UPI0036061CC1
MNDIIPFTPRLTGLVPEHLSPRSVKIHLDSLDVMADIGFHEFEVGVPQRLLVSVEVWLEDATVPADDEAGNAWNYDYLKQEIERIAASRRFNLQETLAAEVYNWIAARAGVKGLRVGTCKPDIYPHAKGVGVELASFEGARP